MYGKACTPFWENLLCAWVHEDGKCMSTGYGHPPIDVIHDGIIIIIMAMHCIKAQVDTASLY